MRGPMNTRRSPDTLGRWAVRTLAVPLYVVIGAWLLMMSEGVVWGNGTVWKTGYVHDQRYFVQSGRPPKPREVSAAYWHVFRAVEGVAVYGVAALITISGIASAVIWTISRRTPLSR